MPASRGFHATALKGGGHGSSEPYYLHAKHMYNLDRMKYQKLTMTLSVLAAFSIGVGVPVFAVIFQQKKTASGWSRRRPTFWVIWACWMFFWTSCILCLLPVGCYRRLCLLCWNWFLIFRNMASGVLLIILKNEPMWSLVPACSLHLGILQLNVDLSWLFCHGFLQLRMRFFDESGCCVILLYLISVWMLKSGVFLGIK